MRTQKMLQTPIWSLKTREETGCQFTVRFHSADGSGNEAECCFRSEKECLHWICQEIMLRIKGVKRAADGVELLNEIQMYERLLIDVAETLGDKVLFRNCGVNDQHNV